MASNPAALERPVRTPKPIGVWVNNPHFSVGSEEDSCFYIPVEHNVADAYAKKHRCSIKQAAYSIAQAEVWGLT